MTKYANIYNALDVCIKGLLPGGGGPQAGEVLTYSYFNLIMFT